jgi:hypothetical protein
MASRSGSLRRRACSSSIARASSIARVAAVVFCIRGHHPGVLGLRLCIPASRRHIPASSARRAGVSGSIPVALLLLGGISAALHVILNPVKVQSSCFPATAVH